MNAMPVGLKKARPAADWASGTWFNQGLIKHASNRVSFGTRNRKRLVVVIPRGSLVTGLWWSENRDPKIDTTGLATCQPI